MTTSAMSLPERRSVMTFCSTLLALCRLTVTSTPGYFFANAAISFSPSSTLSEVYQSTCFSPLAASYQLATAPFTLLEKSAMTKWHKMKRAERFEFRSILSSVFLYSVLRRQISWLHRLAGLQQPGQLADGGQLFQMADAVNELLGPRLQESAAHRLHE